MRITAYINAVNVFKLNPKIACCLASRDWKGFGTRWNYMNGCIVGGGMNSKDYQVRRLTPKEYFRLMGIKDEDYEKAKAIVSDTQLYKIAGNGLVVDVFSEIIKQFI